MEIRKLVIEVYAAGSNDYDVSSVALFVEPPAHLEGDVSTGESAVDLPAVLARLGADFALGRK